MANKYTVKIESVCAGGEHIALRLYKDGVAVKIIRTTKSELTNTDVDIADAFGCLMRKAIASAGAKTNAARKAAIEGMVITL